MAKSDVIYHINEINSYFFRVKVYKHEDGENPTFIGDPTQVIRNIASAEDTLKQLDPVSRSFMESNEHCSGSSSHPKEMEVLSIKDIDHIVSTLNTIQKSIRNHELDKIKLEDIQHSQDILSNYLLIKTGVRKGVLLKG
jgi:hypothetical protein